MQAGEPQITSLDIIKRLKKSIGPRGDFPVSAKVVKQVCEMIESPSTTANALNDVIKRDPTLSARILDIANSPFYLRNEPIGDLSQAIVQLGMKPLGKIVGSLILLQKFVPHARQKGPFAHSLGVSLTLSAIHDKIHLLRSQNHGVPNEADPLLGMLAGIGPLLFSFYFAEIYDSAGERAKAKSVTLSEAIHTLSGVTTFEMSLEVLNSLNLPSFYNDVIERAGQMTRDWSFNQFPDTQLNRSAKILSISIILAELIHAGGTEARVIKTISEVKASADLEVEYILEALHSLPALYFEACERLDLSPSPLPVYLKTLKLDTQTREELPDSSPQLAELREAIASGDTLISILGATLDLLVQDLKFDRALFLTPDTKGTQLAGKLGAGSLDQFEIKSFTRIFTDIPEDSVEKMAFENISTTIRGEPIFEDGWPVVAFPVGKREQLVGIIYADMREEKNYDLTTQDHATLAMVVDLLERAVDAQEGGTL